MKDDDIIEWQAVKKNRWVTVFRGRVVAVVTYTPRPSRYDYEVGGKLLHYRGTFPGKTTVLEEVFVAAEKDLRRWKAEKRRTRAMGKREARP